MKLTTRIALPLLALGLLAAAVPVELQLKDSDRGKLAKKVTAYYESLRESEGIAKAKGELGEEIDKLNKKLSKKAKQDIDVLGMPEDMALIFSESREFGRQSVGKITEFEKDTFMGVPVVYSLHAPKSYKPNKGSVPLILTIPEEGQDPEEHLDQEWGLGAVRDKAVIVALQMPEDPGVWGNTGNGEGLGGIQTVMFGLRSIREDYDIDPDRIFIAGRGAGVAAAAEIASVFPYIFAGVIGRSGDLGELSPANFRNLPCYFAGGGSNVTKFADAATALDYETVTVKPDARAEDVWAWVDGLSRAANPKSVTFAPTMPLGTCYWMTADGFNPEEGPEVTATIDREKNAIAVTSKGISSVTIYFNDALVDLDREVTVICNGVEHKDQFRRNLSTALDQFYKSNDSGRIYTAFQVYDLPETATD